MSARDSKTLGARIVWVLPYVGVVLGLLAITAPAITDCIDAWRASQHISSLSSTVETLSAEDKQRLLIQAEAYNARLAGENAPVVEELLPYEDQLRTDSTTMMAWVEIPSIDVKLPVYHGTGLDELSAGVGHLQNKSLPVGGPSTHCVLTAHSGMAGSRMFDDIRMLEPGDVFVLWTLGDPLAYEVTSSEVVLPDDVSSVGITKGEDLCTLITCTPYGVNSHRLLVHGRRCEYVPEASAETPAHVSSRAIPIYLALAVLAVAIIVGIVVRKRVRS